MPDSSKRDRGFLLAIFVLALVVRIVYLADVKGSPYFDHPLLDSAWYDAKARAVAEGDLLARSGSFRVPLYTYFLAACYAVFGHAFFPLLVVQAIVGAAACALVYLIASRLFGRLAGVYAGGGFAVYRMAIYSDGEILPTTLFIFFSLAAVYFTLRAVASERTRDCLLAGAALGLAFLTRPEGLVLAAALGVAVVAAKRKRGFRWLGLVGIVLVGTMILLAARNQAAFGRFSIISPQGAVNLYMGNARYSDGKTPVAPPTRFPYAVTADPSEDSVDIASRQAAFEDLGRELNDQELSRYYTRKTLAEIAADFPRWLGLVGRKTYYFFNAYELSDIKLLPRFIARYSRVLRLPLVSYALVMPLGLVGLGLAVVGKRRAAWPVVAALVATAVLTVAFFVVWRFRLPAVPFLLVLGGLAVEEGWKAFRARATRRVLALAFSVAALAAFSMSGFLGVRAETAAGTYITNEAALYFLDSRPEQAIAVYREAVEADPSDPRPYYQMGKAYASLGLTRESTQMFEKAASVNPVYRPFSLMSTGITLLKQGAYGEAAAYLKQAVTLDPSLAIGHYNLGLALFSLGRQAEAREALAQAVRTSGGNSEVALSSAQILIELGDLDQAVALAQAVLEREPRNGQAFYTLGLAFERQGNVPQAIAQYETALEFMPSPEIRQKLVQLRTEQLQR